jgi:two-component system CheB/CheR fusion protein
LQILRFYGAAFPYLQPASGKASLHLLKMIRDELIFELRTLIKQVKKDNKSARKERVQLPNNGQLHDITIEVQPIKTVPDAHMLIVFQPSPAEVVAPPAKRPAGYRQEEKERRILSLEKELKEAREHVKSITEDFEATREELQSANEEVLSSNEELQSINEELETSKEELQSTNEELITINEELQLRNNELKEAFDYSRAIIETIREPLMVLNTDLRVLTVNHAFNTIFKLGQDEAEGNFLYEIGNGMFNLPVLRDQLRKMATKNTWMQDFELEHAFPGLGNKTLLLNAMRMNSEPGKKTRILLAIEDRTEGSTAKKALFASEDHLRVLQSSLSMALEAARMGYWDINLLTNELTRSARYDQLMLTDPGGTLWDAEAAQQHIVPEDREAFDRAFGHMVEMGQLNFEGRVEHPEGIKWIRLFGRVIYDDAGKATRATGIIFDISQQKSIERRKDEFISIASHELKMPATSILAYTELLLDIFHESGNGASLELLGKLKGQTDRMMDLIHHLLDISKLAEGQVQLDGSAFDVHELIRTVAGEIQPDVSHRLVLELQPGKMEIHADRRRMGQVLTNLISNAVKYSPNSKKVVVSSSKEDGVVKISVRDWGVGMSPEIQQKVFGRFYRAPNEQLNSQPGLGLGLYISAEIIRQHGGEISLESEPGQGSTFTIALPLPPSA